MPKSILVYLSVALLSTYVLVEQLQDPYWAGWELTLQRHEDMLGGKAHFYNPWQYRILSVYLMEGWKYVGSWISLPIPLPDSIQERLGGDPSSYLPFVSFKWVLLFALFTTFYHYLKKLGIEGTGLRLLGLSLLAFFLYPAQFSADLSLDVYLEALCFLLAAGLLLQGRWFGLLPLTLLAALNRETSGFIPIMILGFGLVEGRASQVDLKELRTFPLKFHPQLIRFGFLALALYLLTIFSLRIYFGYESPRTVYGNSLPWEFWRWNIRQGSTYFQLLRSFTLLPLLAIYFWPRWTSLLKLWAILIIPIWLLAHFSHGIIRETRLFLVPCSLLCIPGILLGIQGEWRENAYSNS